MSMAAKSSNLGNETSAVNSQMEGPMDMPSQSAKDLWESEASGSSPFQLAILVPGQEAAIQSP